MSNPYQPFFDKLDRVVVRLSDKDSILDSVDFDDAADLLKRAGYVLANMLNVQASVYPAIILQDELVTVAGTTEDTSETSVGEGQEPPS